MAVCDASIDAFVVSASTSGVSESGNMYAVYKYYFCFEALMIAVCDVVFNRFYECVGVLVKWWGFDSSCIVVFGEMCISNDHIEEIVNG